MRVPEVRHRGSLRMNMTPMIDVVFLLIIFFLVSSHLAKQEVRAEVDLPAADTGEDPPPTQAPRVTINVVVVDDRYVVKLGLAPVAEAELAARLTRERKKAGSDLEVRIRADRGVPYRVVEPILLACAKSGIWNVRFAVVRREKAKR